MLLNGQKPLVIKGQLVPAARAVFLDFFNFYAESDRDGMRMSRERSVPPLLRPQLDALPSPPQHRPDPTR